MLRYIYLTTFPLKQFDDNMICFQGNTYMEMSAQL